MDKNEQYLLEIKKQLEKLFGHYGTMEKIESKMNTIMKNQEDILKEFEKSRPSLTKNVLEATGFFKIMSDIADIKETVAKMAKKESFDEVRTVNSICDKITSKLTAERRIIEKENNAYQNEEENVKNIATICPMCGKKASAEYRFCKHCGTHLI